MVQAVLEQQHDLQRSTLLCNQHCVPPTKQHLTTNKQTDKQTISPLTAAIRPPTK
jgi:hypothetical protein